MLTHGATQCIQIDYRLGLFLSDGMETARLYVSEICRLGNPAGEILLKPQEPQSLAPILAFANADVDVIEIGTDGQLKLVFRAGGYLEVDPNDQYEAWELTASIGFMMICRPGGSISLFRDRDENSKEPL